MPEWRRTEPDRTADRGLVPGERMYAAGWGWGGGLFLLLVLGGTSAFHILPRGLAQITGAVILAAAVASPRSRWRSASGPEWLFLAFIGLIAVQAVPLPPVLWTSLPGRDLVVQIDQAVNGAAIWRPLTLDIESTLSNLLFAIPAAGVFAAARSGSPRRVNALLWAVAAALAIALAMAILQTVSATAARPYNTAHTMFAIGFFINHNHQAAFLCVAGSLMVGWAVSTPARVHRVAVVAVVGVSVTVGTLLTASRSGLLLLLMALIGWLAVAYRALARDRVWPRWLMLPPLALGGGLMALATLSGGALGGAAERGDLGADRRLEIWPQALELVKRYWPLGSGLGTFRDVYAQAEPLQEVRPLYVNHAHNDFIELAIEGGLPAVVLLACLVVWLALRTVASVRTLDRGSALPFAACISMWLVLAQSLTEYPARTASMSALLALCMALAAARRKRT